MVGLFYKAVPALADEDKIGGSAISTDVDLCPWPSTSPVPGRHRLLENDIQGGERDTLVSTAVFSTTTIIGVLVSKILGMHANGARMCMHSLIEAILPMLCKAYHVSAPVGRGKLLLAALLSAVTHTYLKRLKADFWVSSR